MGIAVIFRPKKQKMYLQKITIICFSFFLVINSCIGQEKSSGNSDFAMGYGASLIFPSQKYVHNIVIEKQLYGIRKWNLRAELSYFHGGPYWDSSVSSDPVNSQYQIVNPSKIRFVNVGLNIRKGYSIGKNYSLDVSTGLLGGYGLIQVKESMKTPILNSNSVGYQVAGYVREFKGFQPVLSFRMGALKKYSSIKISLAAFFYQIGKLNSNLGFLFMIEF